MAAESALGVRIDDEEAARVSADNAHNLRLASIETGMTSGVIPMASYAAVSDMTAALVEADVENGWGYTILNDNDMYVVVGHTDGDLVPAGWTNKSLIKFADFAEVAQLVKTEEARAKVEESALNVKISTEKTRAETAEGVLTTAIATEKTDRANDVNAEESRALAAEAALQADVNAKNASTNSALQQEITDRIADVDSEEARALAAELVLTTGLSQEVQDRKDDVNTEESRATTAEQALDLKIDTEIQDRKDDVDSEVATLNNTITLK
jgi:hypothetical protein